MQTRFALDELCANYTPPPFPPTLPVRIISSAQIWTLAQLSQPT